jgi:hypothetical protein
MKVAIKAFNLYGAERTIVNICSNCLWWIFFLIFFFSGMKFQNKFVTEREAFIKTLDPKGPEKGYHENSYIEDGATIFYFLACLLMLWILLFNSSGTTCR